MDNLLVSTHKNHLFKLICVIGLNSPWYDEIFTYLCNNLDVILLFAKTLAM